MLLEQQDQIILLWSASTSLDVLVFLVGIELVLGRVVGFLYTVADTPRDVLIYRGSERSCPFSLHPKKFTDRLYFSTTSGLKFLSEREKEKKIFLKHV